MPIKAESADVAEDRHGFFLPQNPRWWILSPRDRTQRAPDRVESIHRDADQNLFDLKDGKHPSVGAAFRPEVGVLSDRSVVRMGTIRSIIAEGTD